MAEITLKKFIDKTVVPFIVNLENEESGETETYKYNVKRLGGKAAMQVNLLLAEFSRDKQRDQLLGSSMMKEILDRTTPVDVLNEDGTVKSITPPIINLFDNVDNDGLQSLAEGLIQAAKSSSVSE